MRIGLIIYGLDRVLTGIGRYTLELARALAVLDDELEIVLLTAGGPGPLDRVGLRTVSLPGCRLLPGLATLGNAEIPLLAWRLGLDIVHDTAGVAPFLWGGDGARTAVTIHDAFPWVYPATSTLLESLIYRFWLPHVLPRVDAVLSSVADLHVVQRGYAIQLNGSIVPVGTAVVPSISYDRVRQISHRPTSDLNVIPISRSW